jgi:hypothetical protein
MLPKNPEADAGAVSGKSESTIRKNREHVPEKSEPCIHIENKIRNLESQPLSEKTLNKESLTREMLEQTKAPKSTSIARNWEETPLPPSPEKGIPSRLVKTMVCQECSKLGLEVFADGTRSCCFCRKAQKNSACATY